MKRFRLLFFGFMAGIFLMFGILWIGASRNALADLPGTNQSDVVATDSASNLDGSDETLPSNFNQANQSPSFILPTPIPGESLVYFVPTDNDATATVLYLYNTDTVTHTVALRGFNYDGAMVYAQNINISGASFRRLVSDSVAAAPPPSWATPAPITTNFTDFVYFASLSLPHGVKVEGYVLFNPGTGTVDPRKDQGAIPLRFSTDPATLFMPVVKNSP
jgi:hypothetical protein